MSLTGARAIYEVNGAIYINPKLALKALGDAVPKGATEQEQNEVLEGVTLTKKWNPDVLKAMSPDFAKRGELSPEAIKKAEELEAKVQGDEKLNDTVELLRKSFSEFRDDYEPVFNEMYDLDFKESDTYFPLTRANTQEMNVDMLSGEKFSSAASAMSDHLKKRYHGSANIDFSHDALSKTYGYISQMEHAKHFMPVAENFRALMSPGSKAMIIEKIGVNRAAALQEHMDRIISDGATGPKGSKVVNAIASHTIVTTLMLKTASIPKQMTSMFHYWGAGLADGVSTAQVAYQTSRLVGSLPGLMAEGGATKLRNAMAKDGNPAVNTGKVTMYSDKEMEVLQKTLRDAFLSDRVSSLSIDIETKALVKDIVDSDAKVAWKKLQRILLSPTVYGDILGVLSGGIPFTMATYNNNVKTKGMSHEEAMEDAIEKFVSVSEATQQSRRQDIMTNAQLNPAYRLFLTYTTSQVAAASKVIAGAKVVRAYMKGEKDPITGEQEYTKKERNQALRKMLYYSTMGNLAFNIVSGGYLGMLLVGLDYDDDTPEEEIEKKKDLAWTAFYDSILDMISSDLQGYGIPGKVIDMALNDVRGRQFFNNIPVIKRLEQGYKAISEYGSLRADLNRLYNEGTITEDEYFNAAYPKLLGGDLKDRPEESIDGFYELIGLKNVNNFFDAWEQYSNEADDKDLSMWDAFMGRTIGTDPKTGEAYNKYMTIPEKIEMAKKRGDNAWLYEYLWHEDKGDEGKLPVPSMQKDLEESINQPVEAVESIYDDLTSSVPEMAMVEEFEETSPIEAEGVEEGSLEFKQQYRDYDEIKHRILTERQWAEDREFEKRALVKDKNKGVISERDYEEMSEEIRLEEEEALKSVRNEYKELVGEEPDPSWSEQKVRSRLIDFIIENQQEK
jgi:hypothetical protein